MCVAHIPNAEVVYKLEIPDDTPTIPIIKHKTMMKPSLRSLDPFRAQSCGNVQSSLGRVQKWRHATESFQF